MRRFDMKSDWDVRAGENARKAIACDGRKRQARLPEPQGERDVRLVLEGVCRKFLQDIKPSSRSAVEQAASSNS